MAQAVDYIHSLDPYAKQEALCLQLFLFLHRTCNSFSQQRAITGTMHGRAILLALTLILPALAAPLVGSEVSHT